MTYAMILADNSVRGCCAWDGETPWTPPPDVIQVVQLNPGELCGPGWIHRPGQTPRFVAPAD